MTQLIAIGYRDKTGAVQAAESARELAAERALESDSIATVVCGAGGSCEACTAYNPARGGQWGLFWSRVVSSALVGTASVDRQAPRSRLDVGVDAMFAWQVGRMLEPETSALLLAVPDGTCDMAIQRLSSFGGTVLTWPLSAMDDVGERPPVGTQSSERSRRRRRGPSPDRGDSELPATS